MCNTFYQGLVLHTVAAVVAQIAIPAGTNKINIELLLIIILTITFNSTWKWCKQPAKCCTMCKMIWMGIWQEKFDNFYPFSRIYFTTDENTTYIIFQQCNQILIVIYRVKCDKLQPNFSFIWKDSDIGLSRCNIKNTKKFFKRNNFSMIPLYFFIPVTVLHKKLSCEKLMIKNK